MCASRKRARTESTDDAPTAELVATHEQRSALSCSFASLWRAGQLCDVEIAVDSGERFAAHKLVLSASSDFFKALFTSGIARRIWGRHRA